ncbi:hypothetical protein AC1031_010831 [Aphanomyces cochlioides]|nr:hypothetical protein AC1031_010831 [Aphanomyces cochlioides]
MQTDRGGAANQFSHQIMKDRLQEKWGSLLSGQDISWMLWAGHIVQKPTHEHQREIDKPPPPNLVRFFQPISSEAQQRLLRIQRSVTLASDVVDGFRESLATLRANYEAQSNIFRAEMDQMHNMLSSKKAIIDAFGRDVDIEDDDSHVISALAVIPNQEDSDHA